MVKPYNDLLVWQKGFEITLLVYRICKDFPKEELYGLVSQMRRAGVSIPSNISEGFNRYRRLEFVQFLHVALGSLAELETQTLLAKDLGYINNKDFEKLTSLIGEEMRMLNKLTSKVKTS